MFTSPALQKNFVNIFFRVCLGLLIDKIIMAGTFCEFFWSPRNELRKVLGKFGENSEQNSGRKNSGQNIEIFENYEKCFEIFEIFENSEFQPPTEKFGKLSFCNFPDLKIWLEIITSRDAKSVCFRASP